MIADQPESLTALAGSLETLAQAATELLTEIEDQCERADASLTPRERYVAGLRQYVLPLSLKDMRTAPLSARAASLDRRLRRALREAVLLREEHARLRARAGRLLDGHARLTT